MKTISSHVQDYMKQRPFLAKYLQSGIINYRALARRMKPAIVEKTSEPVSTESIAISLQRLSKRSEATTSPIGTLKGIELMSYLHILSYPSDALSATAIVQRVAANLPDDFCIIMRGHEQSVAVVSAAIYEQLPSAALSAQTIHIKDVAGLAIKQLDNLYPPKPGRLSYPLGILAENAIPVLLCFSTLDEQFIFVDDDYVEAATQLLRRSMAK